MGLELLQMQPHIWDRPFAPVSQRVAWLISIIPVASGGGPRAPSEERSSSTFIPRPRWIPSSAGQRSHLGQQGASLTLPAEVLRLSPWLSQLLCDHRMVVLHPVPVSSPLLCDELCDGAQSFPGCALFRRLRSANVGGINYFIN